MSLARRRPSISVVSCVLLLFSATALGGCSKLLGIHEPKEKRDAADAADESHGSTSLDGPEVEVGGDAVTQDAGIDVGSSVPDASDVGDAMPDPSDALDAAVDAGDVADAMSELPPDPPDAADADAQDDARTDGPAGDVPPVVVDVMTVTLPEALYNVAYSAQLTASGGNGNPLLWTVSDGRLPAGIALDGNGLLHGKPRESGPFQVEVTASDQAGASGTRRLVLNVIRKRWLLFRANTNANDWTLFGLYAVDVRIPNVKLTVSSNIRADSGNVNKFEFSPDGAYVAFLGEAIKDLPQLFVVDMRGDLPGDPRKVNEFGVVRDFAWSPDSKFLAYPVEGDQALDVLVSDVTKPQVPGERVGNPPQYVNAVGFVTPNLLTYFSDAIAFMRRGTDGHFAAPAHLAAGGRPIQIWAELESALFASFGDSCMDSTWTLADFGTPIMTRQLDGYVSAAPRRDYLAHRAREDYKYRIYPAWSDQPMAEFPTEMRGCSPGSWSHDGTMFVTASNDGKLVVTRVQGNSATTTTLAGMYGTLAENGPPVFSADDRWLGFSTADGAYVSARTNGSLGPPVGGGAPVSTPFSWPLIRFSPDATRLATGEPSSTGRSAYATVVDLTKPAPITTQLSFLRARAGSSVVDLAWSAHSTELALSIQEGTFPAPTNLYLLLGPDVGNGASQNLTLFDSCTGYMCLQVTAFQFQP